VLKEVGKGTFGKVLKCLDSKYNSIVAVKVVRSIPKYVDSARIEADILSDVCNQQKKAGVKLCVKMYSDFDYNGIVVLHAYIYVNLL
jgi:serine/threonine protein kinase